MKFCKRCGGFLFPFPQEIAKDTFVYGCGQCGTIYVDYFDIAHQYQGTRIVSDVTYKELLAAYRKVDPNFHKGLTLEEFMEMKKELGDEGLKKFIEENATKGTGGISKIYVAVK